MKNESVDKLEKEFSNWKELPLPSIKGSLLEFSLRLTEYNLLDDLLEK